MKSKSLTVLSALIAVFAIVVGGFSIISGMADSFKFSGFALLGGGLALAFILEAFAFVVNVLEKILAKLDEILKQPAIPPLTMSSIMHNLENIDKNTSSRDK